MGGKGVFPLLSGICGSDLATVDGKSSRYFDPLVSFPFVPGHEVFGELEDGTRVVLEPVLGPKVAESNQRLKVLVPVMVMIMVIF